MSWNIKTPGDYINGPLTVAGAATFQSDVGIGGVNTGFGRLSVVGSAVGAGILGLGSDATRVDIQSYNKPLAINRLGNNVTFNLGGGSVGFGVSPTTIIGASGGAGYAIQGDSWTICSRQGVDESYFANNLYTSAYNTWSNRVNSGSGAYVIAGGNHIWLRGAAQAPGTLTPTESARINTNGAFVLQGGTVGASGVGIAFPAAQSASTDANTLDDYEEGTWTGTVKGSISDPTTPLTATGRYTKVGRQVSVQIEFNNVSTVGASGSIYLLGLPFTNSTAGGCPGSVISYLLATFTETLGCIAGGNGTGIDLYSVKSNSAWVQATHNAGTGRYLWINITYTV